MRLETVVSCAQNARIGRAVNLRPGYSAWHLGSSCAGGVGTGTAITRRRKGTVRALRLAVAYRDCSWCGEPFERDGKHIYCAPSCAVKAHRAQYKAARQPRDYARENAYRKKRAQ